MGFYEELYGFFNYFSGDDQKRKRKAKILENKMKRLGSQGDAHMITPALDLASPTQHMPSHTYMPQPPLGEHLQALAVFSAPQAPAPSPRAHAPSPMLVPWSATSFLAAMTSPFSVTTKQVPETLTYASTHTCGTHRAATCKQQVRSSRSSSSSTPP